MSKTTQADIPQKIDMDDGYFPLAQTALLTLSKTKLSGAQRAIIDVVFTQTYGYYNETSQYQDKAKKRFTRAQISYDFFMQHTWMGKQEVSRAVNQLVKWGILGRDKNTTPYTYWFVVHTDKWAPECWRVSRIANSKQDSEQSTGQLTKSSQDSEQGVSRIANSSQVSAQDSQGSAGSLNKSINKREIKDHVVDDNNARAREANNIPLTLQQEFGRPVSSSEIEILNHYANQGMQEPVICEAVKRAKLHGSPKVSYVEGILKNWLAEGVYDMAGVERVDREFEAKKNKKGVKIRGPDNASTGKHEAKPKKSKYEGLVPKVGGG